MSAQSWLRLAVTVAIPTLTALYAVYPHQLWMTSVIAALATLGTNAIPSLTQQPPSSKVSTSEDTGSGPTVESFTGKQSL